MAVKAVKSGAVPAADQPENTSALLPIEMLREKLNITKPVFAGMCAANGWRPGRSMTVEDFRRAVGRFTGAPIGTAPGKEG